MILTVTPNPSLDRTYEVPSLDRGAVLRATGDRVDPGGKGVNVSRAVAAAGVFTTAVLPLGGASGTLTAALQARPDLIKPNAAELAQAVGRPLATLGEVARAAQELRSRGAGAVLASLGADGQLLVSAEGTFHGTAPVAAVRSDVGAGDASLAGFLIAGGTGPGALASALAHGAAAVQLPGSAMPVPADLRPEAVRVTENPPPDLRLSTPATP
ncbi:1-phosphofructokinase family hexose kinase [Streptomyces sp. NPDC058304]|uniref:1-phosphofructokinase family hexose kinase n=1 Tax=Streptomyces sp. NPDC058304 TaxID=3346437 RepID=UPI0036ED2978